MALVGAGSLYFATNSLDINSIRGQNLILPGCIASFVLSFEDNKIEAKCLEGGKRELKAVAITETIATITFTFEIVNWNQLGFAYDEIPVTSTDVVIPELRRAVVDAGSIVDADITAINEALTSDGIMAYRETESATVNANYLTKVVGAPSAIDEFEVDTGATSLNFTAGNNGATIAYAVPLEYTSIASIGVASAFDRFGDFGFYGVVTSTESLQGWEIVIPKIQRVSTPEFTVNGDLAELELEAQPVLATGKRSVVEFYNFDQAVL